MPPDTKEEALAALQLGRMESDMADIKVSMSKVADALTKIAVLEEKHQTVAIALTEAVKQIEKLKDRQATLEIVNATNATAVSVASKAIFAAWTVLGTGVLALAVKLISLFFTSPVAVPTLSVIAK